MSENYTVIHNTEPHFITCTIVDWVNVFTKKEYKDIIVESLNHCINNKGLIIYSWCIMSNHIHLIITAKPGVLISDIIRDFKKFTSKKIIDMIKNTNESRANWLLNKFEFAGKYNQKIKDYKVWQAGYHPIYLASNSFMEQKLNYIHNNPVKAGLVWEAWHYQYSSAIDYTGESGFIKITKLE